MKKLFVLTTLIAVYCNVVLAQGPAQASTQIQPKAQSPHRARKEAVPNLTKEEIIDFIFAKSQKYNAHFAEYKRSADTIFYNGKVKAEVDINEIDTITVLDNAIKICSKLGIQKFNLEKKKMQYFPDLELSLETHDWNFYEEDLRNRLTRACNDFMKVLRDEQENRRKMGHDPSDLY